MTDMLILIQIRSNLSLRPLSFYKRPALVSLNEDYHELTATIMDKSLGTLLRFWGVFQFTQVQPLPSPHKQCWTRVSRIFCEFQLCIGWGEGELQKHFENDALFYSGNREMTEKYEYWSTVQRTFVQDCRMHRKPTRSTEELP